MEFLAFIISFIAFVAACAALYLVVDAQQMNDEERKELGLGPKGQGR